MAGQGAPTAIAPSDAQWCRHGRQRQSRPTSAPAVTDKFAHSRSAIWLAALQRPRRDAENFGGEVSFFNLPLASDHSITSSASASNLSGISRPRAFAATTLITSSYLVGISTGKSPGFVPRRMGATYCEPARRYASVSLAP